MSSENTYTEISKTRSQFQTLLAGYFKSGLRPQIVNLGSFSDGTRYQVVDQYRKSEFYLVTDLLPPSRNHNILSATHTDSLPAAAVQGDIIVANATPAWARKAKGTGNQFLGTGGIPAGPVWIQPTFSNLGGSLSAGQIPSPYALHGHVPNSGFNPLISNSLGADLTITGTTPTTVGIQVSATARNVAAGLNAFYGAILSVKSPLGTGSVWVYVDGAQYAGPYPVGNTGYGTVTVYVPFFIADAAAHTFDIYAAADTVLHTIVFSGTAYQTLVFVMDLGSGTNIA